MQLTDELGAIILGCRINPQVVAAYKVTLLAAFVASITACLPVDGVDFNPLPFSRRTLLDALIDSAICAADSGGGVNAGPLFSVNGFYVSVSAQFLDIKVTYTARYCGGDGLYQHIPFVVRTVQPVLEERGRNMKKRHNVSHPPAKFSPQSRAA